MYENNVKFKYNDHLALSKRLKNENSKCKEIILNSKRTRCFKIFSL